MTSGDELIARVAPPSDSPRSIDWGEVEGRLGFRLPSDYRWLVERYGPGSFGGFLHILQPQTALEAVRLEPQVVRSREMLRIARDSGELIPYELDELLPVAVSDNGDTVYWVRRPIDDSDLWSIVVNGARNTKWPAFDGGIVAFLVAVMLGDYRVSVFPASFPGNDPRFVTYSPRRRKRPTRP